MQEFINMNTSLVALGALAHRLQNPKWLLGAPKWPKGSEKVSTLRFLGCSRQLLQTTHFKAYSK